FRSVDRGAGRKPRWLTPEEEVIEYLRTNVGPHDAAVSGAISVETMVQELVAENGDLRRQLAAAQGDITALEGIVDRLRTAVEQLNGALDGMTELARSRGRR